jgi:hypothetical protein
LSLFLISIIIVFVWILSEIKSWFMHQCLLVIHGLKIYGQHNWKQLFRGWPCFVGKTRVRFWNNSYSYSRSNLWCTRKSFLLLCILV